MTKARIWLGALALDLIPGALWAQEPGAGVQAPRQALAISWANLVSSIVYGLVGVLLLIGAYYLYELVTPYSVRKELVEDQNIALGIVVGAVILGMAIIIAAAIF